MLSSFGAKRRISWLLAASALAPLSLCLSEPALAQCAGPADSTICTLGGNPYATGINVNTNNTPITVTLQPGVQVIIPAGSGVVNPVNLANTTGPIGTPGAKPL